MGTTDSEYQPSGFEERSGQCPVCNATTLFRKRTGNPWFCTVCGTRFGEGVASAQPVAAPPGPVAPAFGATGSKASGDYEPPTVGQAIQQRGSNHVKRLVLAAIAIVVVAGAGILFASGDTSAQCGPFFAPCSITVNNHGFWPVRIDTSNVSVDNNPVRVTGSGLAWPFGSASVVLYDQSGAALHTMKTLHFSTGPVFGPETAQDMSMQSANPTPTEEATTVPVDVPVTDTAQPDLTATALAFDGPQPIDTPAPAPTQAADLLYLQDGGVHICNRVDLAIGAVQCGEGTDISEVERLNDGDAALTWPIEMGGTKAATLQVLMHNTGGWQVIASAAPNPDTDIGAGASNATESIQALFNDASIPSICDEYYLIRAVNADNHRFGQAAIRIDCSSG